MASVTTALTMMNRLQRLGRYPDVATFDTPQSKVNLDLLNEAMRDVLEGYRHTFDERSDLTIKTFPVQTGTTATAIANSNVVTITSYTGEWIAKTSGIAERFYDASMYLALTEDTTYGDTAFRVTSGWMTSSTSLTLYLDPTWTGATGTLDYTLFPLSYALPATVRSVLSARDQKGDITLRQTMNQWEFDQLCPRPLAEVSGEPTVAVVTGYRPPTELSTDATNTGVSSSLGDYSVGIFPITTEARAINLTYLYRHPEMTAPTSQLVGVPAHIVDTIVMVARAKQMMTVENNVSEGLALLNRISATFATKANAEKPDPFRRRVAKSLDDRSDTYGSGGRLPRPFYTP